MGDGSGDGKWEMHREMGDASGDGRCIGRWEMQREMGDASGDESGDWKWEMDRELGDMSEDVKMGGMEKADIMIILKELYKNTTLIFCFLSSKQILSPNLPFYLPSPILSPISHSISQFLRLRDFPRGRWEMGDRGVFGCVPGGVFSDPD